MNGFDWMPLWISLKTAAAGTALVFLAAMGLARFRAARRRAASAWAVDALALLPLALPPTVVGLLLLHALGRRSWVGAWLHRWDLAVVFTWPAAVIAAVVVALPIMYQAFKTAQAQIDPAYLETARLFGMSERRMLVSVIAPIVWPTLASGVALSFVRALGEFGATLMVAGNLPGRTQTAPMAIYFHAEAGRDGQAWLLAALLAAVSGVFVAGVAWVGRRAGHKI